MGLAPAVSHAAPRDLPKLGVASGMGHNALLFTGKSRPTRSYARSKNPAYCRTTRYDNQDWPVYTKNTVFFHRCCIRLYSIDGRRTRGGNDEDRCKTTVIWDKCGTLCKEKRCGLHTTGGIVVDFNSVRWRERY